MGRNAVENEQQQIDDLIIMIYFSFDHVDTTNLYGTNGLVLVQIKDEIMTIPTGIILYAVNPNN